MTSSVENGTNSFGMNTPKERYIKLNWTFNNPELYFVMTLNYPQNFKKIGLVFEKLHHV